MRPLNLSRILPFFILFLISSSIVKAQVKIGGNPKENPHPSAVLELQTTDKGLLLPRLTQQQMLAIKEPANALVIYNTDAKAVYIYSSEQQLWMPLMEPANREAVAGLDSCEWLYDSSTLRVFLKRGYPLGDSIFYNIARRKFVFADKINLEGSDTPADVFYPGKYIFKGTASQVFHDSASLSFPSITLGNFLFAVDNDSFALANPGISFYNGMRISTQLAPTATQKAATIRSLLLQVNHTGADTVQAVTGMASNVFVDGEGYTGSLNGIQNNLSISSSATNNVGTVIGYRSTMTMAPGAGGRVNSVFGYNGTIGGFRDSLGNSLINGNAYGIFLNNIVAAEPKRNYAFYSGKGHNRFGDSTLITDGFFTSPRAVLDINSSSAMILPTGTSTQRPTVGINGMFRNNTDLAAPEFFDGSSWQQLSTGASEWKFDASSNRVNLQRGLAQGDSVFYSVGRKKFVFADNIYSDGLGVGVDEFYPGKFIFKGTASSVFHDANSLNFPSITLSNHLLDIDNDSFAIANPSVAFYNGMRVGTRLLPTATQKTATIRSLLLQLNHGGQDSVGAVTALASNSFIEGQGYTGSFNGIQNNMQINDSARGDIGTVIGYRNLMTMTPGAGGRIAGNVYGYFGSMSGFRDNANNSLINGSAYGIFLSNISAAGPRRNFGFFSNKGLNRLGDSTLITDQFFTLPRAVLDVNSPSAMIIPSGTSLQRPATGITAMFRNNTDLGALEYFNGSSWQSLASGTAEWVFDAGTNKVNLSRGLPLGDTIFYNSVRKQFVFSDKNTNTNSLGQNFPVENFGGKYTFKATASKRDSTQFNGAAMNVVYEADNTSNSTVYTALSTSAVMNPLAFQKASILSGFSNTTLHAGNDSVQVVYGIQNNTRNSGFGKSSSMVGIVNAVRLQNGNGNNTGEMAGIRNILSRSGATTGRVTGNVYGIQQSFAGLNNNVDGTMYGIFLSNVNGSVAGRNYAYYSNRGVNRFGDSVLVTTGAATTPRAVLDVNATSAMIVPTGNSAQRPSATASVAGMVRYNTENGGRLETYNGAAWSGIISGGIGIDPPNIPVNSGITVSFAFAGATVGGTVSISPSTAPPNGIIIAWARVSAANTIEVRFENNSGAAINPPSLGYNIRVIQ